MQYFLGIDAGGTKTHALVTDMHGKAVGFSHTGPGSWEVVGFDGLRSVLKDVTLRACAQAGIDPARITGAGFGLAGFDWPSQEPLHLEALATLDLKCPFRLVNDALLGIPAGSVNGWGISIVSGTGCNCRGIGPDRRQEARVVGGAGLWSGEAAGGADILARAMRAITYEWNQRGPTTMLSRAFIQHCGARDLDDLIEGTYLGRFGFDPSLLMLVFESAHQGDAQALQVMRWAGRELGGMALGVIHQLQIQTLPFDVILIGSIFDGHPAIRTSLEEVIGTVAPNARLIRLEVPPVVGAVVLGMDAAALQSADEVRQNIIASTRTLLNLDQASD